MTLRDELQQSVNNMVRTFVMAYKARQRGFSEEEIKLHFDIVAAGSDLPPKGIVAHRVTQQQAFDAFTKRIPLPVATRSMREALAKHIDELWQEELNKRKGKPK